MISHSTVRIFSYSKTSRGLARLSVAKQVAAVALGLCYADAAMAVTKDITFCNRNAEAVEVASGYDAVKGGLTSRGWKSVAACSCQELYAEDLRATEVFIHVEKKGAGDVVTSGSAPFCVTSKAFRFTSQNKTQADCQKAGGRWVMFQMVDATGTGKKDFKINFRNTNGKPCNL